MNKNNWMSVKDRLPPVGLKCLWWSNDRLMSEVGYSSCHIDMIVENSRSDGGGVQCVKNYLHNYTHWMYLPSAPDSDAMMQERDK